MYSPVGAGAVGSVVDGCPEVDGWFDAEGLVVS